MKRILLRARRDPFEVVDADSTIRQNLIGNNVGNLVFSLAAYKALRSTGAEVSVDGFGADPADADRINESFDAYVIPLANAFRASFEPQLIRMTRLIERLKIPVVILGVGAQSNLRYELEPLAPLDRSVREFVSAVLDRSPSIGVRGEFTATYLRSLGFGDVEVIGCPSMFLHGDRLDLRPVPAIDRDTRLAVNISPYVKAMGRVVETHRKRYPNLVYVAQDLETLALLAHGDRHPQDDGKNRNPVDRSHPLLREDRVLFFLDPLPWMRFLAERELSFGTRIHGNITSLLAGTPAYVFAHDSRTVELARYFEIPYSPMNALTAQTDIATLVEAADYGPLVRNHRARYETYVGYLARNGLADGIFDPGRSAAFDAQLAAIAFPPPVHAYAGGAGSELAAGIRRLKRHRWVRRVRKVVARVRP